MTKKTTKKGLIIIVCMLVCLSIGGIVYATSADTAPYVPVEQYDTFDDLLLAYKDVPGGYSGAIIRYVDSDENDAHLANGYIRLDWGNYNMSPTEVIFHSLKYNPDVLALATWSGGATGQPSLLTIDGRFGVRNTDKQKLIIPHILDAQIYAGAEYPSEWENEYYFHNPSSGFMCDYPIFSEPNELFVGASKDANGNYDAFTGYLTFALEVERLSDWHKNELSVINDSYNFNTINMDAPLYYASTYFKVLDAAPTGDDIGMYMRFDTIPSGSCYSGALGDYRNQEIALIGFPDKATTPAPADDVLQLQLELAVEDGILPRDIEFSLENAYGEEVDIEVNVDNNVSLPRNKAIWTITTEKSSDAEANIYTVTTDKPGYTYWQISDIDMQSINQVELAGLNIYKGDISGDGVIDVSDLGIINGNYGKYPAVLSDGDLDGDGRVDFIDRAILNSNYLKESKIITYNQYLNMQ